MRIGIDARFYREAGIGRYIRNLLENLQEIDQTNEYFVFLLKEDFERVKFADNFQKVLADFKWYGLAEQRKFPGLLRKYKLDLVHFPHFNIPIFYKGKFVVTIHDLIHQNFQMKRVTKHNFLTYRIKQKAYQLAFSTALKKSQKIITVSDYVKNELRRKWQVDERKMVTTKEAAEENIVEMAKMIKQEDIKKVLEKYGVEKPYVYYLGNAHPHKNVEGLIKAFEILRQRYQYLQLVLSGHDHYFWSRVKQENQVKNVIFTGYVSDTEAVALMKGAKVYVQPSFEEGFGIPLLEAMAAGTAIAASDVASLPEVGGEAAIYFDPYNIEDMAEKIQELLYNEKLRKGLIEKGEKHFKQFSWKKLAEETLKVYQA